MILTNADFSLSVNGFERLKLSLSEKMMESSDGVNELFFELDVCHFFFLIILQMSSIWFIFALIIIIKY